MSEQKTAAGDTPSTNDTASETGPRPSLSRRSLLKRGGLSLTAFLLMASANQSAAAGVVMEGFRKAIPDPKSPGAGMDVFLATTDSPRQQLPYYADGPWDQEPYYKTIQSARRWWNRTYQLADIDGDDRDELIARGPGGILVHHYDPDTGQWVPMSDGPAWSDADEYNQNYYYGTIMLGDVNTDGQAELMIRDHEGIKTWAYSTHTKTWRQLAQGQVSPGFYAFPNMPDHSSATDWQDDCYYPTIHCADINADGCAEIIARGKYGIVAWQFDSFEDRWDYMPNGPDWSDATGWNRPEHYLTIQCADVDNDGAAELVARSTAGVEVYKFHDNQWQHLTTNTAYSDASNWILPEFYRTIQFGNGNGYSALPDIVGDPFIVARRHDAISIQKFDSSTSTWIVLPDGPAWSDTNGWGSPECYETIQCTDIDGDGHDELLGRGKNGLEAWKYDHSTNAWRQLPTLTQWSDAAGWNQVQYYSTITTATVLQPGDRDYTGSGHLQAVVMGRGPLGMQTWRYVNEEQGWIQTSAPFPTFTPGEQAAYKALGVSLNSKYPDDIRASYNTLDAIKLLEWQSDLYDSPPTSYERPTPPPHSKRLLPSGISQDDWDSVTWQIWWELEWVKRITDWYGPTKMGGLISTNAFSSFLTLQNVGNYLNLPPDNTLQISLSILALVGSIAAAILTGGASIAPEITALGVSSAVAGGISAAFSTAAGFVSGDNGTFQTAYNQLQSQIEAHFLQATKVNDTLVARIIGGTDLLGNRFIGDYGRLKLLGQWITNEWQWTSDPNEGGTRYQLLLHTARGYALSTWQALLAAKPWYIYNGLPGVNLPVARYLYNGNSYLSTSSIDVWSYPPTDTLSALFDARPEDAIFPMGVPLRDVYEGRHGWHSLSIGGWGATAPNPVSPVKHADVQTSVVLSRDTETQEIVATVTLRNHGMSPATNAEITEARLGTQAMRASHAHGHLRLVFGHPQTITLRFPPTTAGQRLVLRLAGAHLEGTFGGSYRLIVP